VKVGIIYPQIELGGDPEGVRRIGLATEDMGFDHLLVYDHVLGATHDREPRLAGPYTEKDPFHDPFVMLAYVAAITRRIELVTGVVILPQRQTVLVARQAADVDLLSGERLRLGIGTGWNYVEYDALGVDFATRGARYTEQIELLRKLWGEELVEFDGNFDKVDRAALIPRPKRQIPLWMGGYSNVALRRAARMGDGFLFADGLGDSFKYVQRLREIMKEEGRSEEGFGLQCNMLRAQGAEAVVERTLAWQELGGSHAGVNTMGMGFETIDEHIGYVEEVREALGKAGVM
jgi:probable F420-dependent oxidoreductase